VFQKVDLLAGFVLFAVVHGIVTGDDFALLGEFPIIAIV
jgi:hypothetical protein